MENELESPLRGRFLGLSESLLIALVPVLAYALSYAYEKSYLGYFGVPTSVISIGIPEIVASTFYLVFFLFVWWFCLAFSLETLQSDSNIERVFGAGLFLFSALGAPVIMLKGMDNAMYIFYGVTAVSVVLLVLRAVEAKFSWFRSLSERLLGGLRAYATNESRIKRGAPMTRLSEAVMLALLTSMPFAFVAAAGQNDARKLGSFDVIRPEGMPDLAVVRIYGNVVVAVPFDREKRTFPDEYAVLQLSNLGQQTFRKASIGPLTKEARGEAAGSVESTGTAKEPSPDVGPDDAKRRSHEGL